MLSQCPSHRRDDILSVGHSTLDLDYRAAALSSGSDQPSCARRARADDEGGVPIVERHRYNRRYQVARQTHA
jgi:hypothetical protein